MSAVRRTSTRSGNHSCGIRTDGALACWGLDDDGQASPPDGTFTAVSAGSFHSCGVRTDGTLACWGSNPDGRLATAPQITSPPPPAGGKGETYTHTFTNAGSPPASIAVTAGSLPPGLSLDEATGVLSGTPTTVGSYGPITVTASNGFLADESQTFTIVISTRPVASDDAYTTNKAPLTVAGLGVLANDTDGDGDTLTAALVSSPSHGRLTLEADGGFTYTPAAGFTGSDGFTYRANDGMLDSDVAAVTLSIVNAVPMATDDAYTTNMANPLSEPAPGVLANDTDADDAILTAALDTGPSHGTLTLEADGGFTYTPDTGFSGFDSFTYTASDGTDSGVATVAVKVNSAPVANDDTYTTDEDTPLTVPAPGPFANDADAEGDPLFLTELRDLPIHGALDINGRGAFTYTPDADFNGTDSFTYSVADGYLSSNVATVTLTVTAVNEAPVAHDDAYRTHVGQSRTVPALGVLANDTDVEGDALRAVLADGPGHGTVSLSASGRFTYTPAGGFAGVDSFTYRASDGRDSGVATVSLTVSPVNDDFADRLTLAAAGGARTATNAGATAETGEPEHAQEAGGVSLWYGWTAPGPGKVTVDTAGSDFDTLLAVYTGTAVSALTLVRASDDVSDEDLTSRVAFAVVGGTNYKIALDGYHAATGTAHLRWTFTPAPRPPAPTPRPSPPVPSPPAPSPFPPSAGPGSAVALRLGVARRSVFAPGARVACRAASGRIGFCRVAVRAGGRVIARGARASARSRLRLRVAVELTGYGRRLLGSRLGGVRARVAATGGAAGMTGAATARTRAMLAVEHFTTPPGSWVPDHAVLTPRGRRFVRGLRGRVIAVASARCDGHAAGDGPGDGLAVRLRRARVICDRLGITGTPRLVAHGNRDLIATNRTVAGRARNRRVEVTLRHRPAPRIFDH